MTTIERSNDATTSEGNEGRGDFYHVEIRPARDFKRFRTQDVGGKGGLERVAGQRENGSWETVKWLIGKKMAHIENNTLVADDVDAKELFEHLDAVPKHVEGDRFEVKASAKSGSNNRIRLKPENN